jgi:hypothetical protein
MNDVCYCSTICLHTHTHTLSLSLSLSLFHTHTHTHIHTLTTDLNKCADVCCPVNSSVTRFTTALMSAMGAPPSSLNKWSCRTARKPLHLATNLVTKDESGCGKSISSECVVFHDACCFCIFLASNKSRHPYSSSAVH